MPIYCCYRSPISWHNIPTHLMWWELYKQPLVETDRLTPPASSRKLILEIGWWERSAQKLFPLNDLAAAGRWVNSPWWPWCVHSTPVDPKIEVPCEKRIAKSTKNAQKRRTFYSPQDCLLLCLQSARHVRANPHRRPLLYTPTCYKVFIHINPTSVSWSEHRWNDITSSASD